MASFESRLDEFADRFADRVIQRLTQGISQATEGGSSGAPAPSSAPAPSPAAPSPGGEAGGLAGLGLAALQGAGKGIAQTPAGALGSPGVLAQNAELGATGALLENTIGKVPGIGDFAMSEFHALERAVREPAQKTERSLGAFAGKLAAGGVELSDDALDKMASQGLATERRRYSAERRVERQVEEINSQSSLSWGLSQIGF